MADRGKAREPIWTSAASLTLLGPVRLLNSAGDDHTPKTRKSRALLAIVALAGAPVPRARLCELLWGDRGEEQAKASLRQALYELGLLTESGALSSDRQFVSLIATKLPTDVSDLERRIAKLDFEGAAAALEQVQIPLFSGLDDLTPELDDWLRDERARLRSAIVSDGAELANRALVEGEPASARRIADALERIDPLDERAARTGVKADLALGDRAAAHRRVARISARLKDELGIAAGPDIVELLADCAASEPKTRNAAAPVSLPARQWPPKLAILATLLLAIAAAVALYLARPAAAPASPTLAILPFEQVGGSRNYFATGVSDEIINLLSHNRRIRVLGRVSAEEIAERPNSLAVARSLGITHLLDGSVRTAGNRVLVIVTLTRVSDGAQLWSEKYERRLGDIFAVQSEVAGTVASRLARSFAKSIVQTTSPEVYDRYLAARQLLRDRRDITLKESERLLREAIELDPRYAPAYAELSQVLMLRSDHPSSYGSIPLPQARDEAEQLARKAVQLDPNLGDAYAAMGFLYIYSEKATPYYRKAVELSPQRPEYHRWLAQCLMISNRFDEAIAAYRRAVEIDPLWGINYEHLTGALQFVGRNAEAASIARRFMTLSTDDRAKLQVLRSLANADGRLADNLRYSRMLFERYPDERVFRFYLASALAALGEQREAAELMADDAVAGSILRSDWAQLGSEALSLGRDYWDRANLWSSARLLLATNQSGDLVRLYDRSKPFIQANALDIDTVALPELVLALRNVGRRAEADRLLALFRDSTAELPTAGLGGLFRDYNLAVVAVLAGREEEAVSRIDRLSRRNPEAFATAPAMSLLTNPLFGQFKDDPKFVASDERVRSFVNRERARAGLPALSREQWIRSVAPKRF